MEGFLKDVGHELGFEGQLEQWWVAGKSLEDFSKRGKACLMLGYAWRDAGVGEQVS